MAHRLLIFATWLSAGLLAVTLALPIAGMWIDPWEQRLSLTNQCHLTLWGDGLGTSLVFFNDAAYGPYRGSIISVSDDQGNTSPPIKRRFHIGPFAGIYYRYFRWTGATLWTFALSVWYPALLFTILPARAWRHRTRGRRAGFILPLRKAG
ncbi:MAG: hypothetical protein GC162_15665 [Planctomycetes bacterium]|nr:hypothetical protein [Planctomycetota bacterium]